MSRAALGPAASVISMDRSRWSLQIAKSDRLLALVLSAVLCACGNHGASQFAGGAPSAEQVYGQCAFCHNDLATAMVADGGHGGLQITCVNCHRDLTPGTVGCGHRNLPR